jgi:hypothetical protein
MGLSSCPVRERLPDAWLAAADYLGLVLLTIDVRTDEGGPREAGKT